MQLEPIFEFLDSERLYAKSSEIWKQVFEYISWQDFYRHLSLSWYGLKLINAWCRNEDMIKVNIETLISFLLWFPFEKSKSPVTWNSRLGQQFIKKLVGPELQSTSKSQDLQDCCFIPPTTIILSLSSQSRIFFGKTMVISVCKRSIVTEDDHSDEVVRGETRSNIRNTTLSVSVRSFWSNSYDQYNIYFKANKELF